MREEVKQVFNRHARVGAEQCMTEEEDTADLYGSHTLIPVWLCTELCTGSLPQSMYVRVRKLGLLATTCDWLQQPQLQMDGARMHSRPQPEQRE